MKKMVQIMLLSVVALALVACKEEVETTMSSDVDDFSATTQDEATFTNDDLSGSWWVADFIFTNCTTVCPPMTRNMSAIQDDVAEEGIDNVQFLSFSVDPENDTPEALKSYGEDHSADFDSWTFLTGYDFDMIEELSIESFKSPIQPPPEGDDQVMHGTRFFIINPEGTVVHSYIGTDKEQLDQLVEDLKILTK